MGKNLRRKWSFTGAGILAAATLSSAFVATTANATVSDTPDTRTPIVGGQTASIAEHPWVVYLSDPQGNQFCGGTIVKANKVLTAAHCVQGEAPSAIKVVAGRQDTRSSDGTVTGVSRVAVHPQFQNVQKGSDMAVLTLERPVKQSPLPVASSRDKSLYQPGKQAAVLGWGATGENGSSSTSLRKARPPVVSDEDCTKAYGAGYVARAMVCAGVAQGGVDACQGDSGGPLVADGKLIGIVSWGNGCARPGTPGVYTRVAAYGDFIQDQIRS